MIHYVEDKLLNSLQISLDCSVGCPFGCTYCYSHRGYLQHKYPRCMWNVMRNIKFEDKHLAYEGIGIEFPAHHDICVENIDYYMSILMALISRKNKILLTTKSYMKYLRHVFDNKAASSNVIIRVSITSSDDAVLKHYEPGASTYRERLAILRTAHELGFETYVNIEPLLDNNIQKILVDTMDYVSGKIFIGTPLFSKLWTDIKKMYDEAMEFNTQLYQKNPKILFRRNIIDELNNQPIRGCIESTKLKRIPSLQYALNNLISK